MKKYLLLYLGLFFGVSQLSLAMDYDLDESEYDNGYGSNNSIVEGQQAPYNGFVQNNNAMPMQPGFTPQGGMQNTGMIMQPGFTPQNGMALNNQAQGMELNNSSMIQPSFMPQNMGRINTPMGMNRNNSLNSITKQEHVQSLVNNILKINGRTNAGSPESATKNGRIGINNDLKNKLLRLQKDLEEINKSLNGILQSESKRPSKKKKSKSIKASKKSAKRRNYKKKISSFNRQKDFYTVKQPTPKNARKYIPSSSKYIGRAYEADPYESGVYRMKSWGTGNHSSPTPYYPSKYYFTNKSDCINGCESK